MQKNKSRRKQNRTEERRKKKQVEVGPTQLSDLPPMASSSQRHEVRDQDLTGPT